MSVELRIPLPFYSDDLQVALRYAFLRHVQERGAGVVGLEPPERGSDESDERLEEFVLRRRTFRFKDHVPAVFSMFLTDGAFEVVESEQDAFPYLKSAFTSEFFADRLRTLEMQIMVCDQDRGQNPNAFLEDDDLLDETELVFIDVARETASGGSFWHSTYVPDLVPDFYQACDPVCCMYVLVKIDVDVLDMAKDHVEDAIVQFLIRDRLVGMARLAIALANECAGLSEDDLVKLEEEVRNLPPPAVVTESKEKRRTLFGITIGGSSEANEEAENAAEGAVADDATGTSDAKSPRHAQVSSPRNVVRVTEDRLDPELVREIRRAKFGPLYDTLENCSRSWEQWSHETYSFGAWNSTIQNDDPLDEDDRSEPLALNPTKGHSVELGAVGASQALDRVEPLARVPFYQRTLSDLEHHHFLGTSASGEKFIITVQAIEDVDRTEPLLALVHTKKSTERAVMRAPAGVSVQLPENVTDLSNYLSAAYPGCSLQSASSDERVHSTVSARLLELEQMHVDNNRRVGVLYWKAGQSEDEAFGNQMSPNMDEFLNFFGDRIRLKGWGKFRGGLNITDDQTGEYSVYTEWNEFNVMAHVSTLLPYREEDAQKLDRKRHIGNDLVVVIFWEGPGAFDASKLVTQMCHVFIVIERVEKSGGDRPRYRVACVCRSGVPPFPPYVPVPAIFEANESFRDWLMSKIVNGERAAFQAKTFLIKNRTARRMLIDKLSKEAAEAATDNTEHKEPFPWKQMLLKRRIRTVSQPQNVRKGTVEKLDPILVEEIARARSMGPNGEKLGESELKQMDTGVTKVDPVAEKMEPDSKEEDNGKKLGDDAKSASKMDGDARIASARTTNTVAKVAKSSLKGNGKAAANGSKGTLKANESVSAVDEAEAKKHKSKPTPTETTKVEGSVSTKSSSGSNAATEAGPANEEEELWDFFDQDAPDDLEKSAQRLNLVPTLRTADMTDADSDNDDGGGGGDDDDPYADVAPPISPRDDHDLWSESENDQNDEDDDEAEYDEKPVPPAPVEPNQRPLPKKPAAVTPVPPIDTGLSSTLTRASGMSPRSPRGSVVGPSTSIPLTRKSTGNLSRGSSPRHDASSPRNKSVGRSATPPNTSPRGMSPRRGALTLPPEATAPSLSGSPPAPPAPAPHSLSSSPRGRSSTVVADDLIQGMARLKPSPPASPRPEKKDDDDLFSHLLSRVSSVRSAVAGTTDPEKEGSDESDDEIWE